MALARLTPLERQSPDQAREHHWDVLRAALMVLGIPYHVAMSYRLDEVWIVNSGEGSMALNHLAHMIHVFRMPAFFLIAGYFAALLLMRRAPGQWLAGRVWRLGVPLIAALLILNPVLNLLCELSNLRPGPAIDSFVLNSSRSGGYWVRHLWFIIVLIYLCAMAALLARAVPGVARGTLPRRADGAMARHAAWVVLATAVLLGIWEGAAIEAFYIAGLATNVPQEILRLDQLIEFAPWFVAGFLLCRAPALKQAIYRFSPAITLMAIAATALSFAVQGQLWAPYGRFVNTVAALCLTQCLIALVKQVADRPSATVRQLVDASFVIYLFHLPITAGLVLAGKTMAMPVELKAAVAMVLTLALSWGCWLIVKRHAVLRLVFDGIWPQRPPAKIAV